MILMQSEPHDDKKTTLLRCEDPCAKEKSFATSNHDGLKRQVARLLCSHHQLVTACRHLCRQLQGVGELESMEVVQIKSEAHQVDVILRAYVRGIAESLYWLATPAGVTRLAHSHCRSDYTW